MWLVRCSESWCCIKSNNEMGNSGLRQHLDIASKTGVLTISDKKLKELPPQVKSLTSVIRNFDLSDNRFSTIPEEIYAFHLLKQLNFSHNRIETLSEGISVLAKLEIFHLSGNSLKILPNSLSKLTNLKQVYLNDNLLTDFPIQFCGLKHLDVLELSHNKITRIPAQVGDLNAAELNMNQNQVSVIAEEIALCPRLKILRLEENCLQLNAIHKSLLSDSKIHTLALEGNLFESKQLMSVDGYNEYMEKFTAVKKKMF